MKQAATVETPAERTHPEAGPPDFHLGDLALPAPPAAHDQPRSDDAAPVRRRRSGCAATVAPRPAFMRATDPILRWGAPALLAFAPLAWGSVESWSEAVVVAGAAAIGAVWLLRLALFPEFCAADRSAGSHAGSWSAGLHIPLVVVFGVVALQVVPLGPLVAGVSPVGAEIQRQAGLDGRSLTLSMARPQTLLALAHLAGLALLFFAVLDGLPGRAEARRLAATFVLLGFAHALGGILWHYQSTGRTYWGTVGDGNSFGPYINRNHFACLMGMSLPLGIGFMLSLGHRRRGLDPGTLPVAVPPSRSSEGRAQRLLFGFAVSVMAGALGLSLSRGGIVSTLAALAALALAVSARRMTRGHLWMAGAAATAALAFTVWLAGVRLVDRIGTLSGLFADNEAMAGRTDIWADTLRLATDFPLFGTGFGTFAEVYPRYQTAHAGRTVAYAHSDWVQLLAEGGLAGTLAVLALLAGYAAAAGRLLARRRDREAVFLALGGLGGLLAFLLHAFAEFNAHIPANALWFTVLASFTLKALSSKREQPP